MVTALNNALMKLSKRAEKEDDAKLQETFVDVGALFTILSTTDHQIIYGRRGTGKTHALRYLNERVKETDGIGVYIDMRLIGSNNSLYSDSQADLAQRAGSLLRDTLVKIHDELFYFFVEHAEDLNLSKTSLLLDRLAKTITDVQVIGAVQLENSQGATSSQKTTSENSAKLGIGTFDIAFGDKSEQGGDNKKETKTTTTGKYEWRLSFGGLGRIFQDIAANLGGRRLWIILDEWSSVPLDIQPYLGDLLRRTILPIPKFTVKLAAIEQRSLFSIGPHTDYVGLELGADIAADLDLDDYMVYENDAERARDFFQRLLFNHVKYMSDIPTQEMPSSPAELINKAFTQISVFDEFVRAAEGVPRDAMNIITLAAQRAMEQKISVNNLRTAARDWYQRDKEGALQQQISAHELLHWIIDNVIAGRKARAFLLLSGKKHPLVDTLFDARILHILKKNISSRDKPGVRYDSYKLDYGCYVDLINTSSAPESIDSILFKEIEVNTEEALPDQELDEVPVDDYRAIRRAILDLDEFDKRHQE